MELMDFTVYEIHDGEVWWLVAKNPTAALETYRLCLRERGLREDCDRPVSVRALELEDLREITYIREGALGTVMYPMSVEALRLVVEHYIKIAHGMATLDGYEIGSTLM